MPILGFRPNATEGTPVALDADHKYLTTITVSQRCRVPKLSAKLDGLAGGGGDGQAVRGLIYDEDGSLVAQGEEVTVESGAEASWVDLPFGESGGVVLEPGEYELGLIAGVDEVAQLARITGVGSRAVGADTYGAVRTTLSGETTLPSATIVVASTTGFDSAGEILIGDQVVSYTSKEATKFKGCTGGSGKFAAEADVAQEGASVLRNQPSEPSSEVGEFAIFATYFLELSVAGVEDEQIARYPFSFAQSVLGADPPVESSSRLASCTWHGTIMHPERGSFALVNREGIFADWIGERVSVSVFGGRTVYAYVIADADLEEDDISVTRRLFLELGPLALDALSVRVTMLSAIGEES